MALDTIWKASFPDRTRPQLYALDEADDDSFLPLTDANVFLLDDLAGLSTAQLYALSANNAAALQLAQLEWTNLENLALHIKNRDPFSFHHKDPQALPNHEISEERKEAVLYGYKYEANRRMLPARFTISENVTDQEKYDCREPPEPFAQAGLIPNEKQLKSLTIAAKNAGHEKNPDSQAPYKRNFADLLRPAGTWIAKQMPFESPAPYKTRARDARLNGVAGGEGRLTRFNGERVPLTRDLSEAPAGRSGAASPVKRALTPSDSPASKKRKIDAIDVGLPKKKQPNQYTKRREAEEASRATAGLNSGHGLARPPENLESPRRKQPNQYTKRREQEATERLAGFDGSRPSTPALSRAQEDTPPLRAHSHVPDISNMAIDELRAHVFKDNDLVNLIKRDHSWLNDEPEKALEWKNRIVNAEYPVRTWAMLRKWKEWKSENKDKRPRNKVKEAIACRPTALAGEESRFAGLKPVQRSTRLRTRLDTSFEPPQPSSPLVNGVNARDVDKVSNLDSLRDMGEPDTETKVGAWRQETDLVTSRGLMPKAITFGTEDELYSVSAADVEITDLHNPAHNSVSSQEEAYGAIHTPMSEYHEKKEYEQNHAASGDEAVRRTRSSKSVQSSGADDGLSQSPRTRKLRSSNGFQQHAEWNTGRHRDIKERMRNTEETRDRQVYGHIGAGHWQLRR